MTTTSSHPLTLLPSYGALPITFASAPIDSLYVHVPFCSTKCHYCDFYSLADHLHESDAYLDAIAAEIRLHHTFFGAMRPRTVFIGGGTPTLLAPDALKKLLTLLHDGFELSGVEEFTVEANPNTFDAARAAVLAAHGVNRISFGAQSFNPAELVTLQRDHDPASVPVAFEIARSVGITNLSLDLIFGIPGQTLASWEFSLSQALALNPSHISCYSLTYESNTPMTARLHRGDFQRIDEELELAMFQHVFTRLKGAGFKRYETSNFAGNTSDGPKVCRHNLAYWKAANWLGIGPGAGSHLKSPTAASPFAAAQWKNIASLGHYVTALCGTSPHLPVTQLETLPKNTWIAAAAVFWLRLAEGLNYGEFSRVTGSDIKPTLARILGPFAEQGFAELTPTLARITDKGVPVSNHILQRVLREIEARS